MTRTPNNNTEHGEIDELVQKALGGDELAFGKIYDLFFDKVYRFIFYRVNHREEAEDLTAETFIRVWNKISEINEVRSFNGWVYQIARNLVVDHYRSRKFTLDISDLENVIEYDDNLLDKANLHFQQKSFLAALEKLSADQQIVIKLKFIDDLDNQEIAQILQKTEGAIRVIQHRAILELKNLIDSDEN